MPEESDIFASMMSERQMKKFDAKFLLIQAAILLGISVIAGFIISISMGAVDILSAAIGFAVMILFMLFLFYLMFSNSITGSIARKTMEKHSEEENFEDYSTFVSGGSATVGSILRIDAKTGRIAYVSYQNPYEFQMASAKELTNINSSYIKGPLGGTRYVYFEFYYKNKRVRIPTFTARNVYSLKSAEVLEGISKADAFRDLLVHAQNA